MKWPFSRAARWILAISLLFAFVAFFAWMGMGQAEHALRETEQKLRLMANNLKEMVLAYDMNRKLIYANPAFEQLTGHSIADLQKEGFICWIHPDDRCRRMKRMRGGTLCCLT